MQYSRMLSFQAGRCLGSVFHDCETDETAAARLDLDLSNQEFSVDQLAVTNLSSRCSA